MTNMPIAIVTGGAGFIGSHMVDLLVEEGFEVRVVDDLSGGREVNLSQHSGNPLVKAEFKDIRSVKRDDPFFRGATYVFHFAGRGDIVPSIDKPSEYLSTNVQGTIEVLEAARYAKVKKFVYAASSSCYGIPEKHPTSESAPIDPRYPYALSKNLGEQAVLHWGLVYRMPVMSLRIFNAYGPRSRTTGAYGAVFGVFLKQKLAGKPFTVVGDGSQTRDFVYVRDIAQAFYLAAKSARSQEFYNLGAGNPQSVNYLVKLLGGGKVEYLPKRPGEPDCTWADISKIVSHLGWQPEVSFENGVKLLLEGINYWKDAPLWDKESISEATRGWFSALGQ